MPRVCAARLDRLDAKGLPQGGGLLSELGSAAILAGLPTAAVKPRGSDGKRGCRAPAPVARSSDRWLPPPRRGRLQSHGRYDQHSGRARRRPLFRGWWFAAGSSDFSLQGRLAAAKPDPLGDCLHSLPALHCALPLRVSPLAGPSGVALPYIADILTASCICHELQVVISCYVSYYRDWV